MINWSKEDLLSLKAILLDISDNIEKAIISEQERERFNRLAEQNSFYHQENLRLTRQVDRLTKTVGTYEDKFRELKHNYEELEHEPLEIK